MEDIREYWLVIVEGEQEPAYIPERIVKIWGGNSMPKEGEIIPFSVEKGKKHSKVTNIDSERKKIWLEGVNVED